MMENQMDGGNDDEIQEKIDELKESIETYEEEITEIEENPEGDFPDDLIENMVHDRVREVRDDPEEFLNEYGLEWDNYIDKDDFIEGVVNEDGYGTTLNHYDGNVDEIKVGDQWFYVMRID
jgi:hypothetical protein